MRLGAGHRTPLVTALANRSDCFVSRQWLRTLSRGVLREWRYAMRVHSATRRGGVSQTQFQYPFQVRRTLGAGRMNTPLHR